MLSKNKLNAQAESEQAARKAITKFIQEVTQMDDEDLTLVLPLLRYNQVKKHEFILQDGDICKDVVFLSKGLFRMYYVDDKGKEINYRFASGNNFLVDFQSFLLQKPSHFFWQAVHDSEVLSLSNADIQKVYSVSPAWNKFGRLIAERVYLQMNERVEMLLFMTPEERYNYLLKRQPELFDQLSQFQLSSYLGIKPESLSRLRKRLMTR